MRYWQQWLGLYQEINKGKVDKSEPLVSFCLSFEAEGKRVRESDGQREKERIKEETKQKKLKNKINKVRNAKIHLTNNNSKHENEEEEMEKRRRMRRQTNEE